MKKVSYGFVIITLLCIGLIMQIVPAHADSGWDSSYSGGSSSWSSGSSSSSSSSSSWDSSSHSSSDHSSYSADSSDYQLSFFDLVITESIVLAIIIVIYYILRLFASDNKKKRHKPNRKLVSYDVEKIKEVLPDFDKEEFRMQTFSIYKQIQEAWMNFDYEVLRKNTTDELYNLYHSQLVALDVKKQKNIMKDFKLDDFEVVGMENVDNTVALKVRMTVECFDYVVDKNNKVVRGTDKNKLVYNYEMTFIKGMEEKANKCPNCNAPLENVNSSVCPYCDSIIISGSHDWVLSKKQMISQYRK